MTILYEAGVLGHIVRFLSVPTMFMLASAFPSDDLVVDYLMQTTVNAAPDNVNGWKISIRNSKLRDEDIHRLLSLITTKSSRPINLIALRCVNVSGSGLAPLLHCTQLEHLDLQSLMKPPCGMVFSEVISIVIGVMSLGKLKYLRLPDGWLEEAGRRFQFHGGSNVFGCVGSCCVNIGNSSSSAREWCHQCGCGPFCDNSVSLVHCKATNFKSCKSCWGHQFVPCTIQKCDEWHCVCGCNDEHKEICFDCGEEFYCCMERCGDCSNFSCMNCMDDEHYGDCMRVCHVCDGEFHKYYVRDSLCGCQVCSSCAKKHDHVDCVSHYKAGSVSRGR